MNEQFRKAWNVTNGKFTPTGCEWLVWIGQPLLYDGGLCVNRTTEEHIISSELGSSLSL